MYSLGKLGVPVLLYLETLLRPHGPIVTIPVPRGPRDSVFGQQVRNCLGKSLLVVNGDGPGQKGEMCGAMRTAALGVRCSVYLGDMKAWQLSEAGTLKVYRCFLLGS